MFSFPQARGGWGRCGSRGSRQLCPHQPCLSKGGRFVSSGDETKPGGDSLCPLNEHKVRIRMYLYKWNQVFFFGCLLLWPGLFLCSSCPYFGGPLVSLGRFFRFGPNSRLSPALLEVNKSPSISPAAGQRIGISLVAHSYNARIRNTRKIWFFFFKILVFCSDPNICGISVSAWSWGGPRPSRWGTSRGSCTSDGARAAILLCCRGCLWGGWARQGQSDAFSTTFWNGKSVGLGAPELELPSKELRDGLWPLFP